MSEEIMAEVSVTEETITEPSELMPSDIVLGSSVIIEQLQPADADWPTCWTLDQRNDFCGKYDWLSIRIKNLVASLAKKLATSVYYLRSCDLT